MLPRITVVMAPTKPVGADTPEPGGVLGTRKSAPIRHGVGERWHLVARQMVASRLITGGAPLVKNDRRRENVNTTKLDAWWHVGPLWG